MRRSSPTVLEAAASPVRAWQEDVRLTAERMALSSPGGLLPALDVGVLLEPVDLAALIGRPGPGAPQAAPAAKLIGRPGPVASPGAPQAAPAAKLIGRPGPGAPQAAPAADHGGPAEFRFARRSPRLPPRRAAPPPAAQLPADAGTAAPRSGQRPERWPSSPEWRPAPTRPAAPGAGAARIAAVLQRYEAQESAAAAASAAAGSLHPRALGEGPSPRSDRARTGPSHRKTASPASTQGSRVLVALPARATMLGSRPNAAARGRTALASMADAVGGRLRSWSQGIDVPPLPDPGRSAEDVARPAGPPAARLPSPGDSRAPGGALREAGPTSAGRRPAPIAEVPPGPQLAKLIDLAAQAVGDLAAVERRLAELAAREAPQVQWLEDDELAGRLQAILARQARQRGIDLS